MFLVCICAFRFQFDCFELVLWRLIGYGHSEELELVNEINHENDKVKEE